MQRTVEHVFPGIWVSVVIVGAVFQQNLTLGAFEAVWVHEEVHHIQALHEEDLLGAQIARRRGLRDARFEIWLTTAAAAVSHKRRCQLSLAVSDVVVAVRIGIVIVKELDLVLEQAVLETAPLRRRVILGRLELANGGIVLASARHFSLDRISVSVVVLDAHFEARVEVNIGELVVLETSVEPVEYGKNGEFVGRAVDELVRSDAMLLEVGHAQLERQDLEEGRDVCGGGLQGERMVVDELRAEAVYDGEEGQGVCPRRGKIVN